MGESGLYVLKLMNRWGVGHCCHGNIEFISYFNLFFLMLVKLLIYYIPLRTIPPLHIGGCKKQGGVL